LLGGRDATVNVRDYSSKNERLFEKRRKRYEFNLTEGEVLVKLIESAKKKGEEVKDFLKNLRTLSESILEFFEDEHLLIEDDLSKLDISQELTVGIDGSFQLVGGTGGKWYAPICVVRVLFEGFDKKPKLDVYYADIEEIDETKDINVGFKASIYMLEAETKALLNWGSKYKSSFIFIDGPIVDPPKGFSGDKEYIEERCRAISICLKSDSKVIGCVKKTRDRFYIEFLKEMAKKNGNNSLIDKLNRFPSDQHLMINIFNLKRSISNYKGPLFTKWIDTTRYAKSPIYNEYKKKGIRIISLFFQKRFFSKIMRVDVALPKPPEEISVDSYVIPVMKALSIWTYPGHDYPLPIVLSHEKCKIRKGCAEVLYDEVITKAYTSEDYTLYKMM